LGPEYAEIDAHPTRVRLPDEPLMLVDRVVSIEGTLHSLTSGRVVTEHDVKPDAWYLDGGRMASCVAIAWGGAGRVWANQPRPPAATAGSRPLSRKSQDLLNFCR